MMISDKELDQAAKDGWITQLQRQRLSRNYASWLARSNKGKKHKPKASLKTAEWEKLKTGRKSDKDDKTKVKVMGNPKAMGRSKVMEKRKRKIRSGGSCQFVGSCQRSKTADPLGSW